MFAIFLVVYGCYISQYYQVIRSNLESMANVYIHVLGVTIH